MNLEMHTIRPAVFHPAVSTDDIPRPPEDSSAVGVEDRRIRGRALIFWDPKLPGTKFGRKLDAIDTDQITPAADCVSESLDTLDERWKAGAFRYLMPDFRARVHRGETFVIAGDRFAIGSSREMSPAGLKAIAEEAGLEMVIVCGANMGDIFRRNALNLGLHVVQSPEAVADAQDGDELAFDPVSRQLTNLTQGKTYDPLPLTAKEDEIRRSGGIVTIGRREFRSSVERKPVIAFPDESLARRMTTTEQIVWAHRVDRDRGTVQPGDTLRVYADLLPASDGTAPFAIHTFNQITGGRAIYPRQAAIANDHFVFTGREDDERQTSIGRAFATAQGLEPPYYATPGDGIFHFYFPEQGLVVPGQFIPGADSHSRAYGAYGAVGIGVGSTTLGFGWATGYVYFTLAKARRVVFTGALQPWVSGKDIVLELLRRWGPRLSQGMSVELVDGDGQLPIAYRNTIANMMAEAEAQNGIFAADAITRAWYRAKGVELPYPLIAPGAEARYEIDEQLSLDEVAPMIARPFSPGNACPAGEIARERLTFDKALIGSCTNGSYDDLLQAALVIVHARDAGATTTAKPLVVFPGSGGVARQIERPDPRLRGSSIAQVFRSVGGEIRRSWCGPCFGQGPDALKPGERAITSFNRNWQNRMGVGGEGYLASPAVVAASALAGYMAPPSELGLRWDPEIYGI
jgi:3-isopropylmalate/(R)-2-methylmalate dehydratase large subunit